MLAKPTDGYRAPKKQNNRNHTKHSQTAQEKNQDRHTEHSTDPVARNPNDPGRIRQARKEIGWKPQKGGNEYAEDPKGP
jgi:hypothetical protein